MKLFSNVFISPLHILHLYAVVYLQVSFVDLGFGSSYSNTLPKGKYFYFKSRISKPQCYMFKNTSQKMKIICGKM